jgi:hypothetical protein
MSIQFVSIETPFYLRSIKLEQDTAGRRLLLRRSIHYYRIWRNWRTRLATEFRYNSFSPGLEKILGGDIHTFLINFWDGEPLC